MSGFINYCLESRDAKLLIIPATERLRRVFRAYKRFVCITYAYLSKFSCTHSKLLVSSHIRVSFLELLITFSRGKRYVKYANNANYPNNSATGIREKNYKKSLPAHRRRIIYRINYIISGCAQEKACRYRKCFLEHIFRNFNPGVFN